MISLGVAFFPYISMPNRKILVAISVVRKAVPNRSAMAVRFCQRGTVVKPLRSIIMDGLVKGKRLAKTAIAPSGLVVTGPIKRKPSMGSITTRP